MRNAGQNVHAGYDDHTRTWGHVGYIGETKYVGHAGHEGCRGM